MPANAAAAPRGDEELFSAVQDLGLKLEPKRSSIKHLVVDEVDKIPTEN